MLLIPQTTSHKAKYYCWLDNLVVRLPVKLKLVQWSITTARPKRKLQCTPSFIDCFVESPSSQKTAAILRGREDRKMTCEEGDEIEQLSLLPLVSCELIEKMILKLGVDSKHRRFSAGSGTGLFFELVRSLNLLKPSSGPICPCLVCFVSSYTQASDQVAKRYVGSPLFDKHWSDADDTMHYSRWRKSYILERSDAPVQEKLLQQLCSRPNLPDSHIRIALRYFERADDGLALVAADYDKGGLATIEPLLFYSSALSALLIEEGDRDESKLLSRRVRQLFERLKPTYLTPKGNRFVPCSDHVFNLITLVHWIRSKAVHGVYSVEELAKLVMDPGITRNSRTRLFPDVPQEKIVDLIVKSLEDDRFPDLLVDLREVVRVCIRFFLDQLDNGIDRRKAIQLLG